MLKIFLWTACLLAVARCNVIPKRHIPCEPSDLECVFRYVGTNNLAAVDPLVVHKIKVQLPETRYVAEIDTLTVDGLAATKTLKFELHDHNKVTVTQQLAIKVHGDIKETFSADDGDHVATDDHFSVDYPDLTIRAEFSVVRSEHDGQQFVQFEESSSEVLLPFSETMHNSEDYMKQTAEDKHISEVQKQIKENFETLKKRWTQFIVDAMLSAASEHCNSVLRETPVHL